MRGWTWLLMFALLSVSAWAQTDSEMAALEARLMARLERRLAEESAATNSQIGALRVAVQEAVQSLSRSGNELDRKALVAIDKGAVKDGVAVLEERAEARDAALATNAAAESGTALQAQKQSRAEEWKRIGALAFLENTSRAIAAYEQALNFAPSDAAILEQLSDLYARQARWNDRISMGGRLVALKEPDAQATGYFNIADSYLEQGQPSKARPDVERCLTIARSSHLSQQESKCLLLLAGASLQEGNLLDAERSASEALTIARKADQKDVEGMALFVLAAMGEQKVAAVPPTERKKALQEIDDIYEELERLAPTIHDPAAMPSVLIGRARIAMALGDAALAEARLKKALASMESSGVTARVSYVEEELGRALAAQARIGEAISHFKTSIEKARAAKEPRYEAIALMAWAAAEASRVNRPEACRLAQESYRIYVNGVPELRAQQQRAEQQMRQLCR